MPQAPNEKKASPANEPLKLPKGYKPMSSGQLRLETPEKPGWHRHWFRGTPGRLARANKAGYRFVESDDVDINNFDLAGDSEGTGSTDMGSRVSVISGDGSDDNGQPSRLYLMECPEELYEYAQSLLEDQVDSIAESLRGGTVGKEGSGEKGNDIGNRYLKQGGNLFTRKT